MALIPKEYFKSVFSVERKNGEEFECIGTGFVYFKTLKKIGDTNQYEGRRYLVTANHVLNRAGKALEEVFLRFDTLSGENTRLFRLPLYKDGQAIFSSPLDSRDVAVISLLGKQLEDNGIDCIDIFSETSLLQGQYEEVGLSNGDEVFILGFPMGLKGKAQNYAICRGGMIARVDRETLATNEIYLDAPVFPGNSGGPVFSKPQATHIEGTKAINRAYLLGIATKMLYRDGTGNAGISDEDLAKLEGHLGLAKIVTVDAIEAAIDEHLRRFGSK